MSDTQAIWAALAAVQRELRTQPHTREVRVQSKGGGAYGYTYTELSALSDYLLPLLGAAGIATTYTTRVTPSGDALEIACRLTAGDGSHVESATVIQPAAWGAQDVGKVITYGRRYCLQMATGIATEPDDDNAPDGATHSPKAAAKPAAPARPNPAEDAGQHDAISDAQRRMIFSRVREILGGEATDDDVRSQCTAVAKAMHNHSVSELTKRQASAVIDWLKDATPAMLADDIPL
jgi:hypothetical protein